MLIYSNPRDMGLPHDKWRPGQQQAVEWFAEQVGWALAEAPTGSGKTVLPAAMATERTVTALVKTKALQEDNYGLGYGFDVLEGSGNYKCVKQPGTWCNACQYVGKGNGMRDCRDYEVCEYVIARETAKHSVRRCLNYAYYLSAEWPRAEPSQVLVCDEADELPDLVVEHAGVEVGEKARREWDLPPFPLVRSARSMIGDPINQALGWLETSRAILRRTWKISDGEKKRRCERLGMEVGRAYNALWFNAEEWYLKSKPGKFEAKPLTAKHHFPAWFSGSETVLLMSATIGGDGSTLAEALGLGEFAFRSVPHRWPPEDRPIWIPENAPKLGGKAKPADYEHQADLLAEGLRSCPSEWSGLILTTSKAEAKRVAGRLASRGFEDRVWLTPEKHQGRWAGTQTHLQLWNEEKQKRQGALCVSWNFWRGFDGLDEKIVVAMKAPFAPRGEPGSYQAERVRAEGKLYQWRTANRLAQGCGRTRRGRDEDYGVGSGLVAVLDSNYRMIKKHLPNDFMEAVVQEL